MKETLQRELLRHTQSVSGTPKQLLWGASAGVSPARSARPASEGGSLEASRRALELAAARHEHACGHGCQHQRWTLAPVR